MSATEDLGVTQSGQIIIKRYASRRLYNTQTSDYVTLEDISGLIRAGHDVKIVDLKNGTDLTRQYLLQIIADYEARGEAIVPLGILVDLVRNHGTQEFAVMAEFMEQSFQVFRENRAKSLRGEGGAIAPSVQQPDPDAPQRQQQAVLATLLTGWGRVPESDHDVVVKTERDELLDIKKQLAELQTKLNRL